MRIDDPIKSQLTKEAVSRTALVKKSGVPVQDANIKQGFIQEAIERINKIRLANIRKESMALGLGYTGLNTATNNLDWKYPDIGPKAQAIKNEIESKYDPYMRADLPDASGRKSGHDIQGGLFVIQPLDQDDPLKKTGEDKAFGDPEKLASLVMRFVYRRRIWPYHDHEAMQKVNSAIETIDNYFRQAGVTDFSITDFINELEKQSISVEPYYHVSYFGAEKGGGITQSELGDFVKQQQVEYAQGSVLPGNVAVSNFFRNASQRLTSGQRLALTEQKQYTRKFKNDKVSDLDHNPYLVRAIANKVKQGYALNVDTLIQNVGKEKQRYIDQLRITDTTAMDTRYRQMYARIVKEFNRGLQPIRFTEEQPSVPLDLKSYHWGKIQIGQAMGYKRGIRNNDLTTTELRIMLANLTGDMWDYIKRASSHVPTYNEAAYRKTYQDHIANFFEKKYLGPDEFYVPLFSMTYNSNGLDTDPTDPTHRMALLPAMRKLPPSTSGYNKIIYDRDNGNLGRHHLAKNWFSSIGGLSSVVSRFGGWADKVLRILRTNKLPFEDETALIAWTAILHNRTNAETMLETLQQYPSWEAYNQDHLRYSFASQLDAYYTHAQEPNSLLSGAIRAYQQSGDWGILTSQMAELGLISDKEAGANTKLDEPGFQLLKRYGYQIAKLMDLVSCIMITSCREVLTSRQTAKKEPVQEEVYARQYSTSSGKGGGGQVMIGVRYAYGAAKIVDETSEYGQHAMELLKEEQRRRHDAYRARGLTQRTTAHPENLGEKTVDIEGEPTSVGIHQPLPGQSPEDLSALTGVYQGKIMQIVENLEYFIGESGSAEGMLKDLNHGTDWTAILDDFLRRFPTLESQLGVLISPINARFDLIEVAAKKALDNVRNRLEKELSQKIEIIIQQQDGTEEVLSSDKISEKFDTLQQEIGSSETDTMQAPAEITAPEVTDTSGQVESPIGGTVPPTKPVPAEPVIPVQQESKSLPTADGVDYVGKREKGKRLIRTRPTKGMLSSSSELERLEKIATIIDKLGMNDLADKLDYLLHRLR